METTDFHIAFQCSIEKKVKMTKEEIDNRREMRNNIRMEE